jgi:recombination protein RecA
VGEKADKVIEIIKAKKPKGALITTGNDKKLRKERIPFGIDQLDNLTSGGLSYGRMTLIYGEGSVGKTWLCQKLVANAQRLNKLILYVSLDKSFEPDWWTALGVNVEDLPVLVPNYGEQAWELVHAAIEAEIDLVIMDSIDAIVPTVVAEANMEDTSYGTEQAKCNTTGIRKAIRLNSNTTLVLLNHCREGIGRWASKSIPGGKAQEDFASMMLWVTRGPAITEEDVRIGYTMRITVEKDKIGGHQYHKIELPFRYEGGVIDTIGGLISVCIENGIISQNRASYNVLGESIFGRLKVREYLEKNPAIQDSLRKILLEKKK